MLTDKNLLFERVNDNIGGMQRVYRFPTGYGLSLINSTKAHFYRFAWEAAVLENVSEDGEDFALTYDTELTDDVEVFMSDEETNAFIEKAKKALG